MRVPEKKNWGSTLYDENRELTRQLDEVYGDLSRAVNKSVKVYVSTGAPQASSQLNADFEIGDEYIDKSSDSVYKITNRTSRNDVTWTLIS